MSKNIFFNTSLTLALLQNCKIQCQNISFKNCRQDHGQNQLFKKRSVYD